MTGLGGLSDMLESRFLSLISNIFTFSLMVEVGSKCSFITPLMSPEENERCALRS